MDVLEATPGAKREFNAAEIVAISIAAKSTGAPSGERASITPRPVSTHRDPPSGRHSGHGHAT